MFNTRKTAIAGSLLISSAIFIVQPSHTETQGFFFGASMGLENVETNYEKAFKSNDVNTAVPLKDVLAGNSKGGEKSPYSLSAFSGYRFAMREGGLWIAFQTETSIGGDEVAGKVVASETDIDVEALANYSSEDWSYRTLRDKSAVVKIGTMVAPFRMIDFSIYLLGGVRESDVEFSRRLPLCSFLLNCIDAQSARQVVDTVKPTLVHWLAGAGIERSITGKTGIQLETRYSQSSEKRIKKLPDDDSLRYMLESKSVDVSLRLVRYF